MMIRETRARMRRIMALFPQLLRGQRTYTHNQQRPLHPEYNNPHSFRQIPRELRGREFQERIEQTNRQNEMEEIRKLFNFKPVSEEQRGIMRGHQKEQYDMRMLFFKALARGKVRNFADFEIYLSNFLEEAGDKQAQKHAKEAMQKFVNSFNKPQKTQLKKHFDNLAIIARGGDPYS